MPTSHDRFVEELRLALGSDLELLRGENDVLVVRDPDTGRIWTLVGTIESWANRAADMQGTATTAGVGWPNGTGPVSPGVALLSIHIDETICSIAMGLTETRIGFDEGGCYAE